MESKSGLPEAFAAIHGTPDSPISDMDAQQAFDVLLEEFKREAGSGGWDWDRAQIARILTIGNQTGLL